MEWESPALNLYEVLVPTIRNNGKPIRLRFHKVWDKKVREISGGMTIVSPIKGQWISPGGKIFSERMIPVRIMCSREEIDKIVSMTIKYYEQEAVMFYKISNEVEIKYKDG